MRFDCLANEVFQRQTPRARTLLLQLAHLPRMSGAMAAALGGSAEASTLLASMAVDSLLTSRHGTGELITYEFHPLLRQFLLRKAKCDLTAVALAAVERRAAQLLAEEGDVDAAANVLIVGAHWDALQSLLLTHAEILVGHGWQHTLAGWLAALPLMLREEEPWLCCWQGKRNCISIRPRHKQVLRAPIACFAPDTRRRVRIAPGAQASISFPFPHSHQYFRPGIMSRLCAFALDHDIVPAYAHLLIHHRRLPPPDAPPCAGLGRSQCTCEDVSASASTIANSPRVRAVR